MTSPSTKSTAGILVLLFPLLVLAAMAGHAAMRQTTGDAWRVKIAGYDPRDMLYGHYLRYRFDWNMTVIPDSTPAYGDQTCLCLTDSGSGMTDPAVRATHCEAPENKSCRSTVRVYPHGHFYSLDRDRADAQFWIPEEHAAHIESLLRDGKQTLRVEVVAHRDGRAAIGRLFIDGVPLDEYLKRLPPPAQREGG